MAFCNRVSLFASLFILCSVSVWGQADTLTPIVTFTEHPVGVERIYNIVFSPDGQYIASTGHSPGATTLVWRADNGEVIRRFESPEEMCSVCFTSAGKTFAGLRPNEDSVYLFEFPSFNEKGKLRVSMSESCTGWYSRIAVSQEAGRIAVDCGPWESKTIGFWDLASFEEIERIDFSNVQLTHLPVVGVTEIAFSPSGDRLLVGVKSVINAPSGSFMYPMAILVDVPSLEVIAKYDDSGQDRQLGAPVAYSPDGSYYALLNQAAYRGRYNLLVFDDATLELFNQFSVERGSFLSEGCLAFSPDGTKLLAGPSLCDVATGDLLRRFPIRVSHNAVAYSPDGNKVAISGAGKERTTVTVWDVSDLNTSVADWAQRGGS